MKKLFRDPRLYADLALCAVVLLVVILASGKSLPQMGREALAAVASITGEGTQTALAQFTGTNTIGNATAAMNVQRRVAGVGSDTVSLGTHFACFLTEVTDKSADSDTSSCMVDQNGTNWSLTTIHQQGGSDEYTTCRATCIN